MKNLNKKNKKFNVNRGSKNQIYNGVGSRVLSVSQIENRSKNRFSSKQKSNSIGFNQKKQIKPIIPPNSMVLLLKEKPEKAIYNRRLIDYKHCSLLQQYIGLGGKILPRRQTRLSAKQQRYIAKTIKSARVMGFLPFVSKEKGFFR
uniref:Small ribosomal subunit protein bS18c n=1 Tax=Jenufa perforata TaxID=993091 RepID=A0A0S2LN76_9CHLO|nr:ribosomal protein S18 [Jenufa perforata]ALO62897.1 ribosomal protein S18 [Jenufa perforata]